MSRCEAGEDFSIGFSEDHYSEWYARIVAKAIQPKHTSLSSAQAIDLREKSHGI